MRPDRYCWHEKPFGRRAAGLNQADLAKRAGVRVETVSRLEQAKHSPNVATVDKIVRSLDRAEAAQFSRKSRTLETGRQGQRPTKRG